MVFVSKFQFPSAQKALHVVIQSADFGKARQQVESTDSVEASTSLVKRVLSDIRSFEKRVIIIWSEIIWRQKYRSPQVLEDYIFLKTCAYNMQA